MTPTAGSNADTPKLEDFLKGAVDLIAAGAVVEGTERLLFVADDCLAQRDISSVAFLRRK